MRLHGDFWFFVQHVRACLGAMKPAQASVRLKNELEMASDDRMTDRSSFKQIEAPNPCGAAISRTRTPNSLIYTYWSNTDPF